MDLRTGAAYVLSESAPCVAAQEGRPSGPITEARERLGDHDLGDVVWIEWSDSEWLPVRLTQLPDTQLREVEA